MTLQAQIIEADGKPKFAVIDYSAYEALQESMASFDSLEDFLDYIHATKVKQETTTWHLIADVKRELDL